MGIALLAIESLFAPLQAFFAPMPSRQRALPQITGRMPRTGGRPTASVDGGSASSIKRSAPARPLRVVRVVEPHDRGAGRMVISGRMADVCAELDRLAELESRAH
ncbi:MAG: hypothetical protein EON93_14690 [Burkholderiales bacterium]|nr:MAG: hypothetical protein EON93_14690 [Burkholderiales bacterium]